MQKIEINTNTDYEIFVDDLPKIDLIPKDLLDIFVNSIANELENIIKQKEKRRKYYMASKKTRQPP